MPEASKLDRRRETNSFYQSNMSQYVERYFHLLCVSGDMTLPYNLVYVYNRIDKTRWLSYYRFCSTCMGSSLKPFSIGVAKTQNGNSEGKKHAVIYFRVNGTDRQLQCTSKKETNSLSQTALQGDAFGQVQESPKEAAASSNLQTHTTY